ncbi:MAG TPA: hypothetical protein G4O03_01215 [Dehalococcoidia bacterium]|nr:hypothetical protein [Dehalococcoidia bacterium]
MIWLRRLIALPLALTFIILFILMLVIFRINGTLGNPDFYTDQLRQADIYNFIYDDVLPAALEETELGDVPGAVIDISEMKPHILSMVEQTLPPQWLQTQVEQVINRALPYVLGDTEAFTVNIPLKDRVEAAAEAVKDTLHKEDVFPNLYDQAMDRILDEAIPNMGGLPPPLALSEDELESMVRTVLPPEWILTQIEGAIDEVVPYLTKEKEQFTVRVNIIERLDALETVVADILKGPQIYDHLFEDVVAPAIKQNIQEVTQLPIGVALTDEEILWAVKEILPLDWYQTRVTEIVGQVFSYFRGTQDSSEVVIPLTDRKPVVARVLGELVDRKLESLVDSLPVCTEAQLQELLTSPPLNGLPLCRPPDMSYAEFKALLGIDIGTMLTPLVNMWIPDQLAFTEADLRQLSGGQGDEDMLSQAKEWLHRGLTYTDEDLRAHLGADYETLDEVRQWIASGFTFTEEELRHWIRGMDGDADEQWQAFDEVRSQLGTGRRWKMAAWVMPALILVAIGALGGRRWSSRLVWAAAVLALMAIIAYAIFGPLFSALAQPKIDDALTGAVSQAEGFQALLADKGVTMAQNAIDSFVGGLKSQALSLLAVALALIALGSAWHIWAGKRRA